jgi:thiamine-monophosphate kinase
MAHSVGELGEFGLISAMRGVLPAAPLAQVGPGDDAAVLTTPDGRVVTTVDVLIEGRHFRRDWSSAHDVGRRAAAASLADVVAMGARPTALLVGLGVPADLESSWPLGLAEGLAEEAGLVGAGVIGGDVVRSDSIIVSVTAFGDLEGRAPVLRSGACAGDVLAVAGRLGWAAAGLAVLSRGFRAPRVLVNAHRVPEPPYAAGPAAAQAGATAMLDVSDGLVADAGHIAQASGVEIVIDPNRLVVADPIRDAAAAYNADPLVWLLAGGDDHALLATFPPGATLPPEFTVIGSVRKTKTPGVLVGDAPYAERGGWDHFR